MKYKVVGIALRHNGKVYEDGSIIEMSPAKGKGCNYLIPVGEPDKDEKSKSSNSRRRGGSRRSRKNNEQPSEENADNAGEENSNSDSDQESADKDKN
ncbi:MAG: hypothetical protein AAFP70_21375 [Calditrichota bacterium]